ncbi:hypothetical protein [Mannheimia granulomatis]|nr:hypothetical protein [Mannheimia granulomatis]
MKHFILLFLFFNQTVLSATHQIGILAQRGEAYTRTHWQPIG